MMLSSPSHLGHWSPPFLFILLPWNAFSALSSCYGAVSLQKCIRYSPCPVTFVSAITPANALSIIE